MNHDKRKITFLMIWLVTMAAVSAQKLPHGTVFGHKPSRTHVIQADELAAFMSKRVRVNVSVAGRVTLVTKVKGGWFDVDAGHGNIITAHFKNAGLSLPLNLKNHYVAMDGVAVKKIIPDDRQHYAGGESKRDVAPNRQLLMFEVKGLAVDK